MDFSLPLNWEVEDIKKDTLPNPNRNISTLRIDAKHSFRGIPLSLPTERDTDGFWYVKVLLFNPRNKMWFEVAKCCNKDIYCKPQELIDKLNPEIDKIIGRGNKIKWEKVPA